MLSQSFEKQEPQKTGLPIIFHKSALRGVVLQG